MKNYFLLTLFSLLAVSSYSQQIGKNFIDENYIEVTGKAEMEITPDEIYLKIIVSEQDNKGETNIRGTRKTDDRQASGTKCGHRKEPISS
jgi:hypothetical protein